MSELNAPDESREIAKTVPPPVPYPLSDWQAALRAIASLGQAGDDPIGPAAAGADAQAGHMLLIQEMERERHRIAMDLHDGLGPLLTLIKLELHNAKLLMGAQWEGLHPARTAIERAEENVARTFDELRRAVLDLRPAMLDDLGIVHALRWLIRQFELSGTDLNIQGKLLADDEAVPIALRIVIFRICQETLNNVVKHADARNVAVALDIVGTHLQLSIEDDGRGMAPVAADLCGRSAGGLAGIVRRVHGSNGKLTLGSAGGRGTCLTIRWPLAASTAPPTVRPGNDDPIASII